METEDIGFTEESTADEIEVAQATPEESSVDAELASLREEVKRLTEELEAKAAIADKIAAQIGEFTELFPDVTVETVPDSVWDSVRTGSSLAAAYALYARRVYVNEQRTGGINKRNACNSAGFVGRGATSEYFSPDEVRAMSQKEVRANYSKIIESMKKWN